MKGCGLGRAQAPDSGVNPHRQTPLRWHREVVRLWLMSKSARCHRTSQGRLTGPLGPFYLFWRTRGRKMLSSGARYVYHSYTFWNWGNNHRVVMDLLGPQDVILRFPSSVLISGEGKRVKTPALTGSPPPPHALMSPGQEDVETRSPLQELRKDVGVLRRFLEISHQEVADPKAGSWSGLGPWPQEGKIKQWGCVVPEESRKQSRKWEETEQELRGNRAGSETEQEMRGDRAGSEKREQEVRGDRCKGVRECKKSEFSRFSSWGAKETDPLTEAVSLQGQPRV